MAEGVTCYERDEQLCEDGMCLRCGCRLRKARNQTARELADWLAMIREGNEESVARNDPVIRAHIAKLEAWEKMVRGLAK
jgi:hypothetical protein